MDENDDSDRFVSYIDSDGEEMSKDSLDCKAIKLKIYEETMNNLISENKSLKMQLMRLTEESHEQRDKFMQAIHEAAEDRKKLDEKSHSLHQSQLDAYYDCFVQIEKENDALKRSVHELHEKLQMHSGAPNEAPLESSTSASVTPSTRRLSEIELELAKEERMPLVKRKKSLALGENKENCDNDHVTSKQASVEASLTRWIFRACNYKSDLDAARSELESMRSESAELHAVVCGLEAAKMALDGEKKANEALKADVNRLEEAVSELKAVVSEKDKIRDEKIRLEKKLDEQKRKFEAEKVKLERVVEGLKGDLKKNEANFEDLKTMNVELKRRNFELKSQLEKSEAEAAKIGEALLKMQNFGEVNEQLKSEMAYLSRKVEALLSENQAVKVRMDAYMLEKNTFKCKFEELARERLRGSVVSQPHHSTQIDIQIESPVRAVDERAMQTEPVARQTICMQTEDYNYELIIGPLREEYETRLKEICHLEFKYQTEIEQLRMRLGKSEALVHKLNERLESEDKTKAEMCERSDYLFAKVERLKSEIEAKATEQQKLKVHHDIEKEVLETTVGQQKKFIDFITNSEPDLLKKLFTRYGHKF